MDAARSAPKIGKIIKRARERKRMSQAEAAKALGVSRSALNAWENDRAYPRSSIGAIEALYGISLDDEPETADPIPEDLRAMVRRNFPPDRAEALLDTMEGLLTGRLVARPSEPPAGQEPSRRQAG